MSSQKSKLDYGEEDINYILATEPLHLEPKLLLTAGPTNCSPRTLEALAMPTFVPLPDQDYNEVAKLLIDDIKAMVKHVFQTKNKLTFCEQNSGHGGMETIFTNLVDPGEKVLIASQGLWADRAVLIAENYGLDVVKVTCPPTEAFKFEDLEKEIIKHKPVLLFITHGETSTGVLQPLEGLSEICHRHGCLLGVDAIITFAAVPLFVDRWGIDAIVGAPQKGLSAPPGLVFLSFSDRAVERMEKKKVNPPFYLHAKKVANCWRCLNDGPAGFHYTWNSNMMCAIREAFLQLLEKGLVNTWENQMKMSERLWNGLEKIGLKFWVLNKEKRLPNVTTVILPEGIDVKKVCKYAYEVLHTDISFGIGPTYGKCLRIGIMGYNCRPEIVDRALEVIAEVLDKYPIYSKQYKSTTATSWASKKQI